jgi:RsiW-degrading membrane proteinase PrsW (M82 family)
MFVYTLFILSFFPPSCALEYNRTTLFTVFRRKTCSKCSPKIVRVKLTVSGVIFALVLTRIVEDRSNEKNSRADSDCLRGGEVSIRRSEYIAQFKLSPEMVVVRTTVFGVIFALLLTKISAVLTTKISSAPKDRGIFTQSPSALCT